MFVSLFGVGILVGPEWAMAAAHGLTDRELARRSQTLAVLRNTHLLGSTPAPGKTGPKRA